MILNIPEDILAAAEKALGPALIYNLRGEYISSIAEALMAERERCAKIAESMDKDGRSNWGGFIARAIRSPERGR